MVSAPPELARGVVETKKTSIKRDKTVLLTSSARHLCRRTAEQETVISKSTLFWQVTDKLDIISSMEQVNTHGGRRSGAGRPRGSVNLRSKALADQMLREGHCPATALTRLAQQAEEKGNLALAVDAWKALLPYIHPKPKPVEVDPEGFLALNSELTEMRTRASAALADEFAEALERAERISNLEETTRF